MAGNSGALSELADGTSDGTNLMGMYRKGSFFVRPLVRTTKQDEQKTTETRQGFIIDLRGADAHVCVCLF